MIRRSKPGALHIIALCCVSFCIPPLYCIRFVKHDLILPLYNSRSMWFMELRSRGTHERSILFPEGNAKYGFVQAGNRLAARFTLVILYSLSMSCRFLLEQPGGSVVDLHPRLQYLMRIGCVFKTGIWGGSYATDKETATPKRHELYSNDQRLLRELSAAAGHLSKEELQSFGGQLVKRQKRDDGREAWTGLKGAMTDSQLDTQRLFVCLNTCG